MGYATAEDAVGPAEVTVRAIRDFTKPKNRWNVGQLRGENNLHYMNLEGASEQAEPRNIPQRIRGVFVQSTSRSSAMQHEVTPEFLRKISCGSLPISNQCRREVRKFVL